MDSPANLIPSNPIKIAVLAMGGQGGGVLADWIVDMAEHAGWWAQTTSVPGVAQRTGATIYYLEIVPGEDIARAGHGPTLALMPTPGDVDLIVAAELMEAGRAMQRGLVTPDRSVLISSSHRSYAIDEKTAPGNGIADPNKVIEVARDAAKRFICFDLQATAEKAGSVISASLFGAIAGSRAIAWGVDAARRTGIAVCGARNVAHFGAAGYFARLAAQQGMIGIAMTSTPPAVATTGRIDARLAQHLLERPGLKGVIAVTHQDLAVELGTAREVVSRQLKEFERRGLVRLARGAIVLLQPDTLAAIGLPEREPTTVV